VAESRASILQLDLGGSTVIPTDAQLIAIDMQRVFRDPDSVWCCTGFDAALRNIERLATAVSTPPIFTRFVRDPAEVGTWREYYDRWPTTRLPPDDPAWELEIGSLTASDTLDAPTFSKWGNELARLPITTPLILTGVATDCCVLGTALGAIDAGRKVIVVTDACAGGTDDAHIKALELLGLLDPLITLVTTDELLAQ